MKKRKIVLVATCLLFLTCAYYYSTRNEPSTTVNQQQSIAGTTEYPMSNGADNLSALHIESTVLMSGPDGIQSMDFQSPYVYKPYPIDIAQKWLTYIREGNDRDGYFWDRINKDIATGGYTYDEIGTTQVEFRDLGYKIFRPQADELLENIRENKLFRDTLMVELLDTYRIKSGYTWSDLNTSKEELDKLLRKSD